MTRATVRRRKVGSAQWAALSLLLLFLGGFSFTTLTHDWIGSLPYHEHILMGALGVNHHAHRGDPLDHALSALHSVGTVSAVDRVLTHEEATARAEARENVPGVLSLKPLTGLQPEINTYTATGLLAAVVVIRVAARARRLPNEPTIFVSGQIPSPLAPPPRYV
ncbi:MAG TPA: hypothetical protein VIL85_01765 [Thermomicrobiales bacterium]